MHRGRTLAALAVLVAAFAPLAATAQPGRSVADGRPLSLSAEAVLLLDPEGRVFEFARNRLSHGEFAGVTYGPGGNWLFVNIQNPGMTLAITGPWQRGCL